MKESSHTSKRGDGSSFPRHRHPCSSLLFFKHSFQTQPWLSCPCSLCVPLEWSFSLLMEEHPGLFSAGMLEKQEDHQLALPQTAPALISSWGCLHPSSNGRGGRTRSFSPTHSFLLPTHEDISGTTEASLSICYYFCAHSQPCLAVLQRSVEKRQNNSFFHLHICFQHLPYHLGTMLEMGKKT